MVSGLSRRQWLAIGGFVVVAVLLVAATAGRLRQSEADAVAPSPSLAIAASPLSSERADPTLSATATPTPDPTPTASPTPAPTATPGPTPEPTPTDPPLSGGDPRLLYAEFLLRVNEDRTTVERLNAALTDGAQAQDTAAVRAASLDILDFVDTERDWLRDHPPAACYAKAHQAARAMLAAYGIAAERFFDWSQTGGGLAGLEALGTAVDAAGVAGDKLTAFGKALEATSCPG